MMIKPKPFSIKTLERAARFVSWITRRRFNKMVISEAEIKPNHSYLLMCNHFSFWDGVWAIYLTLNGIHKQQAVTGFYIMSLKRQMEKNWWLKYIGAFSISPGPRSVEESLTFAAEILSTPGNLLLFYPQGNLESSHVRHIEFQQGVATIVPKIQGNCQLVWCSILTEYFESLKPSVYFNMLDCGDNHHFDFETLKQQVNEHHLLSIKKNIRFTTEP